MIDKHSAASVARHSQGRGSRRAELGESSARAVRVAMPQAEVTAPHASLRLRPPASSLQPTASLGFTLIEMLVSLAITLIMMGAVVTLFGTISDSVSGSRSIIEISERLRAARNRLQADLQGATATMKPPLRPENDEGYFEIIEGPMQDRTSLNAGPANATALGDVDDVLMFTVRSRGEPFVGKFNGGTTESQVAEVVYFCAPALNSAGVATDSILYFNGATPVRTYTLYRRVLLVNAGLAQSPTFNAITIDPTYYDLYDVSARIGQDQSGNPKLVPNSLGDLTKREFRYGHVGAAYPATFPFDVATTMPNTHPLYDAAVPQKGGLGAFIGQRLGDDVLLTNVLSFDVQVYDPGAPVTVSTNTALTPIDPGYGGGGTVNGAYADLGSISYTGGQFNNQVGVSNSLSSSGNVLRTVIPTSTVGSAIFLNPVIPTATAGSPAHTYDTWSMHYENNGVSENPIHAADTATNGLDDDGNGIVDDRIVVNAAGQITGGEADTIPPCAAQLRGVRITIRVYEPSSQQVRQMTVVGDFLPD